MRNIPLHLAMAFLFGLSLATASDGQAIPLSEITATSLAKEGNVYQIVDGEVDISGEFLKRIEVGKETLVCTFRNKTTGKLSPNFRFLLFNKYGMELATTTISWMFASVGPAEVRKEEATIYVSDLERVFLHANVTLPKDWREPRFVVVKGKPI